MRNHIATPLTCPYCPPPKNRHFKVKECPPVPQQKPPPPPFFQLLFCFLVSYYIAFLEHIIIINWSFQKLFSQNNMKITIKKCSFIETIHFPLTNSHFFCQGLGVCPKFSQFCQGFPPKFCKFCVCLDFVAAGCRRRFRRKPLTKL